MAEWAAATDCGIVTPNYPLWPCPEGSKARKQIAEIILQ